MGNNKSETGHVGCDYVYRGNVKVKFWENQTDKEAIDEYYKSINKTPITGDIVTVNSNSDKAYVYLNDWEEMKADPSSTNTDPPLMEHYQFIAEICPTADQTDEEAISVYYESINKSPISGDIVSIKNSKKKYVYTGYKWDKWNTNTFN